MKIIILGAGGIGSFYGAKLSKVNDVTLVGRKVHVDKINKDGLKVTGEENNEYRLEAITSINKIEDNTLIILTTKIGGSKNTIERIKSLIKKDIRLAKHREFHKKDQTVKRGLQLTISKINRLVKYYKKEDVLPQDWKYNRETAKALVE